MSRFFFIFLCLSSLYAQDTLSPTSSRPADKTDSLVLKDFKLYVRSKDSIDKPVNYHAEDSIVFDMANKFIYLYGKANIKYQTIDLTADFIIIDMNSSLVDASPLRDSLGKETGIPKFQDGDQTFDAKRIRYNFKTKKGLVKDVVSKESDIFIHGEKSKILTDSSSGNDHVVFNKNGIFTTCDAEEPHFGIYSNKQKIIPNKLIIVGPSIVKIHGIPAPPLMLPFGFFPISKNKSSGLIFPRNYVYDQDLGFGLQDIGYYFPLSDYYDLKLLNSIWFKGSFRVNASSNYRLRYKYSGKLSLDLAFLNRELPDSYVKNKTRTFKIKWDHTQLPGSHPYRTFSGGVDLSFNPFDRLIYRDFNSATRNILYSNLNYSYNFPNSPMSISAGISHDQNLNTRVFNMTLPSVNFSMRAVNPFKNKNKITQSEKWYEKITLNYGSKFINKLSTFDSILFEKERLKDLQYGFTHNASLDVNFKLLKYINVVPQIRYDEEWFFKEKKLSFNSDTIFRTLINGNIDTIYGKIDTAISEKFNALRTMNASLSLNTQLYGQILSKRGWFRGIRHVMAPSVSMVFSPNYRQPPFQYFGQVDSDSRPLYNKPLEYLYAANSPFGTGSVPSENFIINFGLSNRIEMKYHIRKDSSNRKLTLLDNFNLSGNYNVFADSFKLSNIVGIGRMSFFKGISSVNFDMSFDPYARKLVDGKEMRVNSYLLQTDKKIAHFTSSNIGINSHLTIPQVIKLIRGNKISTESLPTFGSLFETFSIAHQLQLAFRRLETSKDTFYISVNSISFNGYINLTSKWRINIGQIGYDFLNKLPTYPDFGFERDLHCWTMKFNYYPSRNSFTFFIGVKTGSLDFIKIPSNRNFTGGF